MVTLLFEVATKPSLASPPHPSDSALLSENLLFTPHNGRPLPVAPAALTSAMQSLSSISVLSSSVCGMPPSLGCGLSTGVVPRRETTARARSCICLGVSTIAIGASTPCSWPCDTSGMPTSPATVIGEQAGEGSSLAPGPSTPGVGATPASP